MTSQMTSHEAEWWDRLVRTYRAGKWREFLDLAEEFLRDDVDRVKVIRHGLRNQGSRPALYLVPRLPVDDLVELFDDLVGQASTGHGAVGIPRDAILSLPRDWVLRNIESVVEPYLRSGTYDEYRRFLELYILLDHELTKGLARRAAAHTDPDIREAGEDFLERLNSHPGVQI